MRARTKRLPEPGDHFGCHDYTQTVGNNASPPASDTQGLGRFNFVKRGRSEERPGDFGVGPFTTEMVSGNGTTTIMKLMASENASRDAYPLP